MVARPVVTLVCLRGAGKPDEEDGRDVLNICATDAKECSYFVGSATSVGGWLWC